jgi:DNA (cytosine-5)-methyltransferase 1
MTAYYNEIDPYCAQWLRNLIDAGHIAPGDVDERDIRDVRADDVRGYTQCHFFAGIGGWSYALRLAGWDDSRECWTGSCPCQPLSVAGQRQGHADERHLWPAFHRLIAECSPAIVFGEQVASADGREWLAGVRADLEALGYACGASDLCAASVAAPHSRQRLYWMAHADGWDASTERLQRSREHGQFPKNGAHHHAGMGDANGRYGHWWSGPVQVGWNGIESIIEKGGREYRAQWRIRPGLSLLAHGVHARSSKLRAYGNAIVPQVAAQFIAASWEAIEP